ncbi:hypothetical protein SAMN02745857_03782 [Andreprevotia lacus DSM 23236]|uniref:Uncharacterized protein n=1 Tax=Andreprevotia lacus DSM 23236 TaxID=1121001 RepID=A0A1W1XZQ1_9NEIS|nr:hypothetical protein [Andreprevotia lacus]SMC29355.1 hypothetical protein SAMN02745857_03782 [Andreprevotia lacus DSM 23236]
MIKSPIFVDIVLPTCIAVGFVGFFLVLILSRLLYDYVRNNYGNLIESTQSQTMWVDQDMAGAFIGDVWALTRRRGFLVIESAFWRGLFWVNAVVGGATIVAVTVICAAFLFF